MAATLPAPQSEKLQRDTPPSILPVVQGWTLESCFIPNAGGRQTWSSSATYEGINGYAIICSKARRLKSITVTAQGPKLWYCQHCTHLARPHPVERFAYAVQLRREKHYGMYSSMSTSRSPGTLVIYQRDCLLKITVKYPELVVRLTHEGDVFSVTIKASSVTKAMESFLTFSHYREDESGLAVGCDLARHDTEQHGGH